MHKYKYTIDPVTRIEGHLGIEVLIDDGIVQEAKCSGTLFRGLEIILKGRDPRDANRFTQRICGVCPTVHAKASAMCLDDAFGITDKIPVNGRILRNLILGCNFIQSHVLHFYHLAALDYVDATKAVGEISPFTPCYKGDYRLPDEINNQAVNHYIKALDIRRKAHELLAIFGGKMPHNIGIIPGGITEEVNEDKIADFLWRLNEIRAFISECYLPDLIAVAKTYPDYFAIGKGCGNLLSYGGFELGGKKQFEAGTASDGLNLGELLMDNITEDVKHSWYADSSTGKKPAQGETVPEPDKKGGYSFIKSPRYNGQVFESGPLANMVIAYLQNEKTVKKSVDNLLSEFKAKPDVLFSVLGRHAARGLECKIVADAMADWVLELKPGEPSSMSYEIPAEAEGAGLTTAPRGSLGHWISIKDKKIDRYQVITPTAWNASPKDDKDQPGPVEQAVIGTKVKDKDNPFEVVRIIRAFDPCLACSVHVIDARGHKKGNFEVV